MNKLKIFLGVCIVAASTQLFLTLPSKAADFFAARPFVSRGFYSTPNPPIYWGLNPYPAYSWNTSRYPGYNYSWNSNAYPAYNYGSWNTSPSYNYVVPNQSVYPYSAAYNPLLNVSPPLSVTP